MPNYSPLRAIYNHPLFTNSQLEVIFAGHVRIKFHKKEFLLRQGQISKSYYIIETGLVRFFVYDYKGKEITTQFCGAQEIVNDVNSMFSRLPTENNIQAVTDLVLWKIDFDVFQEFYHSMQSVSEWGRLWMSHQLFECQKRSTEMITESASSRYLKLLSSKPYIIQQAPLKQISSYLGVTDSSLSRIRKELASNS